MTLPAGSSAIAFSQIQSEFGGANPISLSEYYGSNSGYVPPGIGVPSSGGLNVGSFHGTTKPIMYYANANSVTTIGDETVIVFSTGGTGGYVKPALGTRPVRVLIVGPGGRAGSGSRSGGGGSGGAIDYSSVNLSSGTNYPITVGTPDVYDTYGTKTASASNSSIGSLMYATPGANGTGSGDYGRYAVAGDSGYVVYNGSVIAGSYVGGNYNSSGGYKTGNDWGAGGGGGASSRGVDGLVYSHNAYGGNGIATDITGSTVYLAGGGNGSSSCGYLASNGYGGGAAGGYGQQGGDATNYGGGSGAGCAAGPGTPYRGLVVIRGKFTAVPYTP